MVCSATARPMNPTRDQTTGLSGAANRSDELAVSRMCCEVPLQSGDNPFTYPSDHTDAAAAPLWHRWTCRS